PSSKEMTPSHAGKEMSPGGAKMGDKAPSDRGSRPEGVKSSGSNPNDADMRARRAEGDRDQKGGKSASETRLAKNPRNADEKRDQRGGGGGKKSASASTGAGEGTEGRSGPRNSVNITEGQRSKMGPIFGRHHVDPPRGLNVSVNVGVAIPRSVRLYPVPE